MIHFDATAPLISISCQCVLVRRLSQRFGKSLQLIALLFVKMEEIENFTTSRKTYSPQIKLVSFFFFVMKEASDICFLEENEICIAESVFQMLIRFPHRLAPLPNLGPCYFAST